MNRQQRRAAGERGPLFTREERKQGLGDPPQPQATATGLQFRAWNQWKALAHASPMQCPAAFVENVMDWGVERLRSVTIRGIAQRTRGVCTHCIGLVVKARIEGSAHREFQRAELEMKREVGAVRFRLRRDGRLIGV